MTPDTAAVRGLCAVRFAVERACRFCDEGGNAVIRLLAMVAGAACFLATPSFAGHDILPVKGLAGARSYDVVTGQQSPIADPTRNLGPQVWAATWQSGFFWADQGCGRVALDWGDVLTPVAVGAFGFSYATNADPGFECIIMFYNDDNGWDSQPKSGNYIAAYRIADLAGTLTPQNRFWYWNWVYRVELATPLLITASDLDNDALGDWGYTYWFGCVNYVNELDPGSCDPNDCGASGYIVPNTWIAGPLLTGDPNVDPLAPGIEDAYDLYTDPNYVTSPGYIDPNLTHYAGTYWFGGFVYAQFYMELFAAGCPNRGDAGRYCQADIVGFDCIVGLPDLAELLGNYGCTTGCTLLMGDVDPHDPLFPGDGVIGLSDLAEMLGQYGDDCN